MIVLDTQHVSQLQRAGSRDAVTLEQRLSSVERSSTWITVVTPYEQLRAAISRVHAAAAADQQVARFRFLADLLEHYATRWKGQILTFDTKAAQIYQGFDSSLIRKTGRRDAWIAAIALAHDATLLTSNLSDFREVPGLVVRDWLRPEPDTPEASN